MSTQFTNDQWRLPNAWNGSESNVNKQSNYSMDFDGTQNIDCGDDSSLTPTNSISISLWVKTNDSGNYIGLIDKWSSSTGYMIHLGASGVNQGKPVFGIGASDISSSVAVNDGSWHHVAVTCDNTTGYIYVDGVQTGTGSLTMSGISNSDNLKIAGDNASTFYLDGQIDAVSIFDYALSSSQITTLYGSSSTGIGNPMSLSPKPVAYYPLGDQDSFNGADYLVPNSSLKDYVFDFDGSNDAINISNNSVFNLGTSFTISGWFNVTSYVSNMGYISFDSSTRGWFLFHQSTNLALYDGTAVRTLSSNLQPTNEWNSYIITYDGTDLIFYLNGQQNSTQAVTSNLQTNGNDGQIGNQQFAAGRFYNGSISNVQIFNSALPATGSNSVETLYNNGSPLTSMSGFTSLQGWWKLDASATYDGSNWTIPDDSSNSNDGTSYGMTQANLVQSDLSFTSGYSPYALDFDGTNDYINLGTTPIVTGIFTFSLWIKRTSTSSGADSQVIIGKDGQSSNRVFNVFMSLSGVIGFWVSQTGGYLSTYRVNTSTLINDTNWHNLIVINNGDNNNNQVFIDGTEASYTLQGTGRTTLYNTTGIATSIGSSVNAPTTYAFNGKLSNVSIWNTALTSAQVTEIYSEGIPQNLNNHSAVSSLVSWWQLGSNSSFNTNWTVLDEKGSNNGTSVNMDEVDIVDGVGSYANGLSSGMGGDEVIGDAPYSTANSLSVNMDVLDRVTDTPS